MECHVEPTKPRTNNTPKQSLKWHRQKNLTQSRYLLRCLKNIFQSWWWTCRVCWSLGLRVYSFFLQGEAPSLRKASVTMKLYRWKGEKEYHQLVTKATATEKECNFLVLMASFLASSETLPALSLEKQPSPHPALFFLPLSTKASWASHSWTINSCKFSPCDWARSNCFNQSSYLFFSNQFGGPLLCFFWLSVDYMSCLFV